MRSMPSISRWVFVVAAVLVSRELVAESLGAAAKREKERRARNKEAGVTARVIEPSEIGTYVGPTDDKGRKTSSGTFNDLSSGSGSRLSSGPSGSGPSRSSSFGADESAWRDRAKATREQSARAQKEYDDATSKPLALGTPGRRVTDRNGQQRFVPGFTGEDARKNRQNLDRRDNAQRQRDNARASESKLEEDARRAGVPPGWLR